MVDNSSHSDVVFKLATKTYYAHRYVLACGSDVLRQLLGVRERVRGEGLDKRLNEGKMTQERINSGQVDGLLHIEERLVAIQAINCLYTQYLVTSVEYLKKVRQ